MSPDRQSPISVIPYAYSPPDYDRTGIFPTLELAVLHIVRGGQEAYAAVLYPPIVAHMPDGTEISPDLKSFMTVNEADVATIEAQVDKRREESRLREEREDAEWCANHGTGRHRVSFSSFHRPYHQLDRQTCIDHNVAQTRYAWRAELVAQAEQVAQAYD